MISEVVGQIERVDGDVAELDRSPDACKHDCGDNGVHGENAQHIGVGRRTFGCAWHNITVFILGAQSDWEYRKQDGPPDDEKDCDA